MAIKDCQASFSNSRIKPRAATTTAVVTNKLIPGTVTLIYPYNENRTTLSIRNESLGSDFRYGYSTSEVSPTTGFLIRAGEACELQGPMPVYACSVDGTDVPICGDEGSG